MNLEYSDKKQYNVAGHSLEYLCDYYNQRIILLESFGEPDQIIEQLKKISREEKAGKIIAYARDQEKSSFEKHGFIQEGIIQGYFLGQDAYCYSYFNDLQRRYSNHLLEEDRILEETLAQVYETNPVSQFGEYHIRNASESDADNLALFMGNLFTTYPTPVHRPEYLKEIIRGKTLFKLALHGGKLVCAASADRNKDLLNAEITDCVTHPDYRGQGLTGHLICLLEQDLTACGYMALYSLARAMSPAINRALRKNGFEYGGRLINNCSIMGTIEDMNIWSKLAPGHSHV